MRWRRTGTVLYMRHLWSLLAGVVAAPLVWLLLATGQHRAQASVAAWEEAGRFDTVALVGPVIFLVVAGLLLGVLGTLRWSPAGPVAAGVLLVLPTIFVFVNPFRTLDTLSYPEQRRLLWQDFSPWLPVANGTLLVLGILLLVAVASVQRWRQWPVVPGPIPPATDDEVVEGVARLTERGGHSPMSDDEILAAAAALDEQTTQRQQRPPGEPTVPQEEPPDSGDQTGQDDQAAPGDQRDGT